MTTITREQARDVYLHVFDNFAVDRKVGLNPEALTALTDKGLLVKDQVNGKVVWQCRQTYDAISRDQAIRLFDQRWAGTVGLEPNPNPVQRGCLCGCGALMAGRSSKFVPGHDARYASQLIRAAREGQITEHDAIMTATDISQALGRKVDNALTKRPAEAAARKVKVARVTEWRGGVVKIGRWDYPARQDNHGSRVERNTKRSGEGEWVDATAVAETFRKV